ncbi:hypothetical protein VTI74DRAFT_1913 [Chaetomium olivicolor]
MDHPSCNLVAEQWNRVAAMALCCSLLLWAQFFLALPLSASPVSHERRELGGVLICNEPNAQGHWEYAVYEFNKCYDLPPGLRNNAATFAPDGDAFFCYPYAKECSDICLTPSGCTRGAVSFYWEHKFNLTTVGWNTLIGSFVCHRNQTSSS